MPYRSLPKSDPERSKAITAASRKAAGLDPADSPLNPETTTKLNAVAPQFESLVNERSTAEFDQVSATDTVAAQFEKVGMYVSHFFQVFQFGVSRGQYEASERVLLGLSANQTKLPELTSQPDILLWAQRIVSGEADRVAAGAAPMANPAASEIATLLAELETEKGAQSGKKDLYDDAQKAVAAKRPEVDAVILDVWDELEFAYRLEENPAKRRKCREWGVVYRVRPGEPNPEGLETEPTEIEAEETELSERPAVPAADGVTLAP